MCVCHMQAREERIIEELALAHRKKLAELEEAHQTRMSALRKEHQEAEDRLANKVCVCISVLS